MPFCAFGAKRHWAGKNSRNVSVGLLEINNKAIINHILQGPLLFVSLVVLQDDVKCHTLSLIGISVPPKPGGRASTTSNVRLSTVCQPCVTTSTTSPALSKVDFHFCYRTVGLEHYLCNRLKQKTVYRLLNLFNSRPRVEAEDIIPNKTGQSNSADGDTTR